MTTSDRRTFKGLKNIEPDPIDGVAAMADLPSRLRLGGTSAASEAARAQSSSCVKEYVLTWT